MKRQILVLLLLLVFIPITVGALIYSFSNRSKAIVKNPANIVINTSNSYKPLPSTWKAIAQGGEEQGVSMIEPIIEQTRALSPRYIRIDHIYDFYNVVRLDRNGDSYFVWDDLDKTVCDIAKTGARPFLSLSYMPQEISSSNSIIDPPRDWNTWSVLVQKTIEHYSGSLPVCGSEFDKQLEQIYYEVWNEPDHQTFGGWSIYNGRKDYKELYYYSAIGAQNAISSKPFFIGGPATTAPYRNWMRGFLEFVKANNLRLDFISWHRYTSDSNLYSEDVKKVNSWLDDNDFREYQNLPKVISEWGFDSEVNVTSDTQIAAAHAVSSIRNLIEENLELAFIFELKDGLTPSWGIVSYSGEVKPRYQALQLLNNLSGQRLLVTGENEQIKAIASRGMGGISVILSNYDIDSVYREVVPVTFTGLEKGKMYRVTQKNLDGNQEVFEYIANTRGELSWLVDMIPNRVVSFTVTSKSF